MPSFGEKLKAEREKRSITLEQISLSTKIGTRMLQALEEDKFNQLPGGIFNKGFVRAYARHLGIDEEQAIADYLDAAGENIPTRLGSDSDGPTATSGFGAEFPLAGSTEKSRELPWGLFAAALLAIALGLSLWTHHKRTAAPAPLPEEQQSSHPTASEEPLPNPEVSDTGTADNPSSMVPDKASTVNQVEASKPVSKPATEAETAALGKVSHPTETPQSGLYTSSEAGASATGHADGFTVQIQVREDSWISIISDGKNLASYMASAGEERAIRGRQLVTIRAGNVGGVDFLFNGKKLSSQGENGQVKTLTFGPEGLQSSPDLTQ